MLKPPFQLAIDSTGRKCFYRTDSTGYTPSLIYGDDMVSLLEYIIYLETTIIKLTNMFKD